MKVNMKGTLLGLIGMSTILLGGCNSLLVLDPKGPQAKTQADDIMLSIFIMAGIVLVVLAILAFMLIKYRASKQSPDYEPPHIEGSAWVEAICIGIPVIIVIFLSFVSVKSNFEVENVPEAYANQEPLVIPP